MNLIEARLVDGWRDAWRWSSMRLHAFMLLWSAVYALAPALPPEIAAVIPSPFRPWALAGYALLGLAARVTQLKKS